MLLTSFMFRNGGRSNLPRWDDADWMASVCRCSCTRWGFPGGSAGKESTCNAGDLSLIPGFGRSPGEWKGYPLEYSGLENSLDCIVHGVAEADMTEWLSLHFTSCTRWREGPSLLLLSVFSEGRYILDFIGHTNYLDVFFFLLNFVFCIGVEPINNFVTVSGE